jgi:hypothetical protein
MLYPYSPFLFLFSLPEQLTSITTQKPRQSSCACASCCTTRGTTGSTTKQAVQKPTGPSSIRLTLALALARQTSEDLVELALASDFLAGHGADGGDEVGGDFRGGVLVLLLVCGRKMRGEERRGFGV